MEVKQKINQKITIDDLRKIKEFEKMEEAKALEIIDTITQLSQIIYDNYKTKLAQNQNTNTNYLQAA